MSQSTSVPEKSYRWDNWKRFYAVEAATKESPRSNLPGREDGAADAYRHLLWAGELTRGIALGKSARTWKDVIEGARTVVDRSDRTGAGGAGEAKWLPATRWRKNPIDDTTGQPLELNLPDTDWVRKVQALRYDYPFGGEEHRYAGESGSHGDEIPVLERAVGTWSEGDVRRPVGGSVHVAAHSWEGGKVAVSAYDRSTPSG